ncbi:MAG: 50S ribosomal protein L17 [Planctomycetes bacterium]|nr:50S ribosomal protein L17 [Planctomycetota bacterium]
MRHKKKGRKLGRTSSHRKALRRNLAVSLLTHERIRTTAAKAKEARGLAEKVITLAKEGSLHSRRRALSFLQDRDVVSKLFDDIAPRYQDRNGGYTRILHLDERRLGDNAPQVLFELVGEDEEAVKKPKADAPKVEKKEQPEVAAPDAEAQAEEEPQGEATSPGPKEEPTEAKEAVDTDAEAEAGPDKK